MLPRKATLAKRFPRRSQLQSNSLRFWLRIHWAERNIGQNRQKRQPAGINLIFHPLQLQLEFYYCFTVTRRVMKHDLRPRFSHRRIESSKQVRRGEGVYSVTRFLTSFPCSSGLSSIVLCLLSLQRESCRYASDTQSNWMFQSKKWRTIRRRIETIERRE